MPEARGDLGVDVFLLRELDLLLGREFGADCRVWRNSSVGSLLDTTVPEFIEFCREKAVVGVIGPFCE